MARTPRAVTVTRPTEYELLLRRHATRGQAEFFLRAHGQKLADVEAEMNEGGVVFGDGIESDHLDFGFGMRLSVHASSVRLCLVA